MVDESQRLSKIFLNQPEKFLKYDSAEREESDKIVSLISVFDEQMCNEWFYFNQDVFLRTAGSQLYTYDKDQVVFNYDKVGEIIDKFIPFYKANQKLIVSEDLDSGYLTPSKLYMYETSYLVVAQFA